MAVCLAQFDGKWLSVGSRGSFVLFFHRDPHGQAEGRRQKTEDSHTDRPTDTQINRQTDRPTDRQTDRQVFSSSIHSEKLIIFCESIFSPRIDSL